MLLLQSYQMVSHAIAFSLNLTILISIQLGSDDTESSANEGEIFL